MNSELSTLNINWTHIVSSSLSFPVDETFKIVILNLKLVKELFKILDLLDKRTFANYIASETLLEFKDAVLIYFILPTAESNWGVVRSFQRFEQCNKIVQDYLPVALTSLMVRRFAKLDVIDAAYEVANRTIDIIIHEIENDDAVQKQHRDFLVNTIRSMNLILGYPKELLEEGKIEKVYEKLNLTGNENLIHMVFEGFKFKKDEKFRNMIKEDDTRFIRDQSATWTDYTTEDEYITPLYTFLDDNTICKFLNNLVLDSNLTATDFQIIQLCGSKIHTFIRNGLASTRIQCLVLSCLTQLPLASTIIWNKTTFPRRKERRITLTSSSQFMRIMPHGMTKQARICRFQGFCSQTSKCFGSR